MPAIPVYQQQTTANAGGLNVHADPNAFGGATAAAASNLASAGMGALDAVQYSNRMDQHVLKIQEEKDAKSWSGTAISQATLDWTKNMQERQTAALPGAPDFTGGVLTDFDKYSADLIANAPTPMAKEFAKAHLTQMRTQVGEQAIRFEGAARVNLRIDNAQTSIDNAAKVVQQDPSQYGRMMSLVRETMPEVGPDVQKKLNDHLIQSLTNAAASQVMDKDPYAVQDATSKAMGHNGFTGKTGVPWVDDATADQVKNWNSAATTKIHMLESEQARNADARMKVAESTFNAATDLTFKGQFFSDQYKAQLRDATKGTQWADATEELIRSQAVTAGFASAPASDRNAVLNSMRQAGADPTKGTNPESAKQIDKIAAIDNEIRKAVIENPWAASQKYGVSRDASVVNVGSAADAVKLIQARGATQTQVETWAGGAISPLQPAEASQLSDVLSAMPPPARGAALAQIAQGMPLGRLEALATQLDAKDKPQALALKFTDQTNAGRPISDLILRGSQALADKTVKKDDTALAGWKAEIASLVRGTMGSEKLESDVIDAAYYVRAAMDQEGAGAQGFKIGDSAKDAVRLVIGQPMERNGVKTILPRGMDDSAFDKALSIYTPEVLKTQAPEGTFFLRGQPVTVDRFSQSLDRYAMTRDGKGNYIPSTGGAFVTIDKAGTKPLRLPVHQ